MAARISGPKPPPPVFTLAVVLCPACRHGIDPHTPGQACGVGLADGRLCACRWTPNEIAGTLIGWAGDTQATALPGAGNAP